MKERSIGPPGKRCAAQKDEGLGIIDLRTFNLPLLGKWVWRLGSDKGGLW